MIKIEPVYSDDFMFDYCQKVINQKVLNERLSLSQIVPEDIKGQFLSLFSNQFICDLILCDANQLRANINTIYTIFPVIAERYCLEYLLKEICLTNEEIETKLTSKENKDIVIACHRRVINELSQITQNFPSVLLQYYINEMNQNTLVKDMRTSLKVVYSMICGTFKYKDQDINLFPNWVNKFPSMFNYEYVSKNFGHRIVSEIGIEICPYCNNEDIEQIEEEGAEDRPDLDHYFPKSKFPFLAVSLSNLIPSGNRCNQTYKRSNCMFEHIHPYINGINNNLLFEINYNFSSGITDKNVFISLHKQRNDLDNNMDLFKIRESHSKKKVKRWFINLHEKFELLRNVDRNSVYDIYSDPDKIRTRLDININTPLFSEEFQKFKLDSLQQLLDQTIAVDNN